MLKKITTLITCGAIAISLTACGSQEKQTTQADTPKQEEKPKENKPAQKELNDTMKKEAVKGDFVELNSDNPPKDKKLFLEGEINSIQSKTGEKELQTSDYFMLKTQEETGIGIFKVMNGDIENTKKEHFKAGDKVRIYGVYMEKDITSGMPVIASTIIEKVQ